MAAPSTRIKVLENAKAGVLRIEPVNLWLSQLGQFRATVYTAADEDTEANSEPRRRHRDDRSGSDRRCRVRPGGLQGLQGDGDRRAAGGGRPPAAYRRRLGAGWSGTTTTPSGIGPRPSRGGAGRHRCRGQAWPAGSGTPRRSTATFGSTPAPRIVRTSHSWQIDPAGWQIHRSPTSPPRGRTPCRPGDASPGTARPPEIRAELRRPTSLPASPSGALCQSCDRSPHRSHHG